VEAEYYDPSVSDDAFLESVPSAYNRPPGWRDLHLWDLDEKELAFRLPVSKFKPLSGYLCARGYFRKGWVDVG
jgi:hypothetical protein